jgi:hypothetical protein
MRKDLSNLTTEELIEYAGQMQERGALTIGKPEKRTVQDCLRRY